MNFAIITAAGHGTRMNSFVPKQFITVFDKPILVYTLECFQHCSLIDGIVIVSLPDYFAYVRALALQYGISKVIGICPGGETGQQSILSGVLYLKGRAKQDDVVLIHDGNRPLVPEDIIEDCIKITKEKGNACACIPCNEAMLKSEDGVSSCLSIPRDGIKKTQTPHGIFYGDLVNLHREAAEKSITNSVATITLLIELGHTVYFSKGSVKNFKITSPGDIEVFKSLLLSDPQFQNKNRKI